MSRSVEQWALLVMLVAGCVLLVGAVLDGDWLRAVLWTVALVFAGTALRRRGRSSADAELQ